MSEEKDFDKNDMQEDQENLYVVTDEDDKKFLVKLIDEIEVKGVEYRAVIPVAAFEDEEVPFELIMLKRDLDVNGEYNLTTIDDDDEFDLIGSIFTSRIQEKYSDFLNSNDDDYYED